MWRPTLPLNFILRCQHMVSVCFSMLGLVGTLKLEAPIFNEKTHGVLFVESPGYGLYMVIHGYTVAYVRF